MSRAKKIAVLAGTILAAVGAVWAAGVVRSADGVRAAGAARPSTAPAAQARIVVHKSPTCGCCKDWIEHLERHGFRVEARDREDMGAFKDRVGVPATLRSCHTALAGGYVLEGHVPADLVRRLLDDAPRNVRGLAVPGMPVGSPGMEVPGRAPQPYDVLAFDARGKTRVYARR